jgi:hypothetical protein
MEPQPVKPVLNYVTPGLLEIVNEGGCAILSVACPALLVIAMFVMDRVANPTLRWSLFISFGPVAQLFGLYLALPATRKTCPLFQRRLAWLALLLNFVGMLVSAQTAIELLSARY